MGDFSKLVLAIQIQQIASRGCGIPDQTLVYKKLNLRLILFSSKMESPSSLLVILTNVCTLLSDQLRENVEIEISELMNHNSKEQKLRLPVTSS
jgi:hypothetical protein